MHHDVHHGTSRADSHVCHVQDSSPQLEQTLVVRYRQEAVQDGHVADELQRSRWTLQVPTLEFCQDGRQYSFGSWSWPSGSSLSADTTLVVPDLAQATVTATWLDTGACVIDLCPADPDKTDPGVCGCGIPEADCTLTAISVVDTTTQQPLPGTESLPLGPFFIVYARVGNSLSFVAPGGPQLDAVQFEVAGLFFTDRVQPWDFSVVTPLPVGDHTVIVRGVIEGRQVTQIQAALRVVGESSARWQRDAHFDALRVPHANRL